MENFEIFSEVELTLVAACGLRGEMGLNNKLPWHQPADLAFFKELTQDGVIICGRRTYQSLPGLLPRRRHIVVSRTPLDLPDEVGCVSSWRELQELLCLWDVGMAFLIGGAQLYESWGSRAARCWITHFHQGCQADCFFPMEILQGRKILEQHAHEADAKNWARTHVLYGPRPKELAHFQTIS